MVKSTVNNVKVSVSHNKVSDNKVRKPEQVEMQMYLSKLKELVPYMPKNRKVSKVEVIEYVIDYICDLQGALEKSHPSASAVVTAMLNNMAHQQQHNNNNCLQVANANLYHNLSEPSQPQAIRNNSTITTSTTSTGIVLPNRQPLVSLPATPNNAVQNSCAQEVSPLEKSPSQDSSRTVLPC